jgi:hypothetical protein
MKTINVQISDDSVASNIIQSLEDQIQDSTKQTPEYQMIFGQVTGCIEDFSEKSKKLARSGTTIHIEKTFSLPETNILITLEYPRKLGFMDKLKKLLNKS